MNHDISEQDFQTNIATIQSSWAGQHELFKTTVAAWLSFWSLTPQGERNDDGLATVPTAK